MLAPVLSTETRHPSRAARAPRLARAQRRATIEDWLAIPEEKRAELIDGRIVYHALPGPKHGTAQGEVYSAVRMYRRGGGGHGGGGSRAHKVDDRWWISLEVDMSIGPVGCRPDVVGWRRDKHPRAPEPNTRGVCTEIPDFICEVMSRSTARYDQGAKRAAYFDAGVGHYWLVDPTNRTLTVLKRTELGYVVVLAAGGGETVHAPPFENAGVVVSDLFFEEDEENEEAETSASAAAPAAKPGTAPRAKRASKARASAKKTHRR